MEPYMDIPCKPNETLPESMVDAVCNNNNNRLDVKANCSVIFANETNQPKNKKYIPTETWMKWLRTEFTFRFYKPQI